MIKAFDMHCSVQSDGHDPSIFDANGHVLLCALSHPCNYVSYTLTPKSLLYLLLLLHCALCDVYRGTMQA